MDADRWAAHLRANGERNKPADFRKRRERGGRREAKLCVLCALGV